MTARSRVLVVDDEAPNRRIASVADVYDALATRRSCKDSYPREKCLAILREEAAKGFRDREVVDALAGVVGG